VNENVLVVPTSGINPLLEGVFTKSNLQRCLDFILGNYSFRSRATVEEDPSFKQIIPYVLIRHEGRYLLTQRTSRQTEKRLHNKYSLGIGGHINDLEQSEGHENVLYAGLERELSEEVLVSGPRHSLRLAGIISDDSTEVGKVHLGLVFMLETGSPEFSVQEPDLMTAAWADMQTLTEKLPHMETWSQIAFENVIAPAATPAAEPATT
jgi:predicted NUDIX family phosphoesterase